MEAPLVDTTTIFLEQIALRLIQILLQNPIVLLEILKTLKSDD